ncbi:site-specific integrase [Herbaspirillum sp. alder98]|uniref:site-specific integrase n=1 Tax=Herbaspirillum sp. alder98 TaxID=2913096 RepID=UPI001CD84389|nr:site-specific integrase [Herbaspirillum sp. alder98]MCA1322875.1 site-specific integrase [Herbaspirillum sp. alder98]
MAYIQQRGEFWRVEIRRRGHKPVYHTFDSLKKAQQEARRIEAAMDAGSFVDKTEAERTTLREALERYRKEVVPTKRHQYQEDKRIDRWLETDLAYKTLAGLRGADFAQYRDQRRALGRAENTIRLELQLVSHLFEIARKEWRMEGLSNPLKNIRKPGGSKARERRLAPGEYEKILAQLQTSSNAFAAAAFTLAIETSLRQGTLFKLQWEWIRLEERLVHIPKTERVSGNKGVPATLPLSTRAVAVLNSLKDVYQVEHQGSAPAGDVLATSVNAVICLWKRSLKKLGISDLRWHDLRHEAVSRLFERGLNPLEAASISGHKTLQMLARYTHLRPESLLDRLG